MKLKRYGKSIRNKKVVTLPRFDGPDLTFTIFAMGPEYADKLERELPTPKPEFKGFARGRKGSIEFDQNGNPIKLFDDDHPAFLAKLRMIQQLQTVKVVHDALDPEEVTFETPKEDRDPVAYYTAIRDEMSKVGFSIGDIEALGRAASEASNVNIEKIMEARQDFFGDPTSQHSTPNTRSAADKGGATKKTGGDSATAKGSAGSRSSS